MSFANLLFSFKGRVGRQAYWLASLYCTTLALLGLFVLRPLTHWTVGLIIFLVWCVLVVWVTSAPCIKRCHDLGFSGWWFLITLIPLVGNVAWFIWAGLIRGNKGPNKYGDDPLQADPSALCASLNTNKAGKILIAVPAFVVGALIVLRIWGLVRPFSVPTGAMTPAVSAGDHIMMEGVSFLSRQPRRGDIVVLKTDGIALVPPGTFYVKRVAGEPGDHLRISQGKLFINEKQVSLSNAVGEIVYDLPPGAGRFSPQTDLTIPDGCYFVLGDNSTNSLDSRFWGSVPRGNIIGRVSFCYWPPQRVGGVK